MALAERVRGHVWVARRAGRKTRVHCWLRSLLHRGLCPTVHVLETIAEGGDWEAAERTWIGHFRQRGDDLTNITGGGDTGCLGYRHTPETRQRMSLAQMGNTKGRACRGGKRQPLSAERKRQVSLALIGRPVSEATRRLRSRLMTGRVFSEETRAKMSRAKIGRPSWSKGKKFSPEHRAALSRAKLGKPLWPHGRIFTAEHRQAMRAAWNRRKRAVA